MGNPFQLITEQPAKHRGLRAGCIVFCILTALMFLILPVMADPTASFSASPTTGEAPLKVTFTRTSTCDTDDCDYEWDFDDGDTSTSSSTTVTHTFDEEGTYEVTLTVTNDDDEEDDYSKDIEVEGEELEAKFTSDRTSGIFPLTVEFEDTSTGDPEEWYWTFGDGNTSTSANPEHTYLWEGNFKVTLKVTNDDDDTDTVSKSGYVSVGEEEDDPEADFSADETEGDAPLTVQFTDESDGFPSEWKWTFGDGETSTDQNPEHEYEDEGTYSVTLKVTNDEGTDSLKKTDFIVVGSNTPVAAFVASATTGTAPLTVTFTDRTTNDPTEWYWTFGDGTTSATQSPSHTYATAGTYTVTLKATNDAGTNTVTKSSLITISAPKTTAPTTTRTTVRTTVPTTRPTVTATTTAPPASTDSGISWPIIGGVAVVAVVIVGIFVMRGRGGGRRWDL